MCKRVWRALVWSSVLWSTLALAVGSDKAGSKDLVEIERYPLSFIVEYQRLPAPEYRLALGSMQKVNGVVSPERVESISGELTRVTYQIPAGHGSREAFDFIRRQLMALSGEVLFECSGRDCGSSNQWANSQFDISKLYGIDREQRYLAYRMPATQSYIAVYAVKRGNKRVYLHVDHIAPEGRDMAADPLSISAALRERKRISVRPDERAKIEILAQAVAPLLAENLSRRLLLVGHSAQGLTTGQRVDNSRRTAAEVRALLVSAGVDGARVDTFGVGSLAPAYSTEVDIERVELLLQ